MARQSIPTSVRTDRFPIDLKLNVVSGVLLHTIPASWSAVPLLSLCQATFSSAMPMLGGLPERGAQPLRTHLTVCVFLPTSAVCTFTRPRSFYLASGGGFLLQVELRVR